MLRLPGSPSPYPVFPAKPTVSVEAFRSLLRLVAGVEDCARRNSHKPRQRSHLALQQERFKKAYMSCLVRHGRVLEDTEWHAMLASPLHTSAWARLRVQFPDLIPLMMLSFFAFTPPTADDLALFLLQARRDAPRLDAACRLALSVRDRRRWEFRSLTPRAIEVATAARL